MCWKARSTNRTGAATGLWSDRPIAFRLLVIVAPYHGAKSLISRKVESPAWKHPHDPALEWAAFALRSLWCAIYASGGTSGPSARPGRPTHVLNAKSSLSLMASVNGCLSAKLPKSHTGRLANPVREIPSQYLAQFFDFRGKFPLKMQPQSGVIAARGSYFTLKLLNVCPNVLRTCVGNTERAMRLKKPGGSRSQS